MLRSQLKCGHHAWTSGHSEKIMSVIKDILVEWRVTVVEYVWSHVFELFWASKCEISGKFF